MSLISLSVSKMREGLLKGDFTAVELCQAHLDRIEKTNQTLNSFITVCSESAHAQALAADKTLQDKKEKSPVLTGIPVSIKDMLVTKGIRTTCASKILGEFIPPYDCTAVTKLKERGAVIVGKTNLDEFAMGSSNEHSAFGPVRNPWDNSKVPGGSSGGSAVSVSVGQSALSLGTDTGGSIRQPASLTGVYGIKPTYGRVSRYGAVAYASSLDQIGPFARSVEDLAICLEAISGHDTHDSTSMHEPVPHYLEELRAQEGKNLKGLRIGIPKEYFISGIDAEVEASVKAGLSTLESLGATLVEISLPHTEFALAAYYIIAPAEASSNLARYDGVRYGYRSSNTKTLSEMYEHTRGEGFGREVKRRIMIGNYVLSAGYYDAFYRKAQQIRTLIVDDFKSAFANHCDVIATPVSPTTAFSLGENLNDAIKMYLADVFTIPTNLAGLPGISVPCGLDSKRLPIGLQLLAAPFKESLLFSTAQAFEKACGFDGAKQTK